MKKFKKPKPVKKIRRSGRWIKWNNKLDQYGILIELADVSHLSKRAFSTGYLSPKVLKKWRNKSKKRLDSGYCKRPNKCVWLPATIFKKEIFSKYSPPKFWWRCLKCGCVTNYVWEHELSEPMLNAYRKHTRVFGEEAEELIEE